MSTEAVDAGFPESRFPCDPSRLAAYRRRNEHGTRRMSGLSAVFCGLARDVREALPSITRRIEETGELFRDYRVVVYENDSMDGTADYLSSWEAGNTRVTLLSESLDAPRWNQSRDPERTKDMAAYRNRCLDHVQRHFRQFDVVLVLDFDLVRGFSPEGLANTFGHDGWDMMGSNGLLFYRLPEKKKPNREFFDAWAFRRPGEHEPASFNEINHLRFNRGEDPVPVWSSFGGLGVYRMDAFTSGARYGGGDCEHVVFHRGLSRLGFDRLFLNPSQIVLY